MGKYIKLFLTSALMMFVLVIAANATTINPGSETSLQSIFDGFTIGGHSSLDAAGETNDALMNDSPWSITGSGGSFTRFVAAYAGNSSSFGIYDATDSSKKVEITFKNGSALLEIEADGRVILNLDATNTYFAGNSFGYYITSGGNTFYSDTNLNTQDNFDHFVAFQGNNKDVIQLPNRQPGTWTPNEYILAWEDLPIIYSEKDGTWSSDRDYNDLVVMVESVQPVPEPSSLLLLGCGLVGLGVTGYRKIRK